MSQVTNYDGLGRLQRPLRLVNGKPVHHVTESLRIELWLIADFWLKSRKAPADE